MGEVYGTAYGEENSSWFHFREQSYKLKVGHYPGQGRQGGKLHSRQLENSGFFQTVLMYRNFRKAHINVNVSFLYT